jgi:hypothetical protein
MAWRITNQTFFIAPGATTIITFWWPGGNSDHGAQWAMAHPVLGESEDWLMSERVGKHLACEIGQVVQNGPAVYRCVETGRDYEYRVFIRNDGTTGCRFQLEGGGVN